MSRAAGRAIAAAIIGALAATLFTTLLYVRNPRLQIDFGISPPRIVSGIHPDERDDAAGITFAWTGEDAAIRLPGLDRRSDWILSLRVRGARSGSTANPDIAISADGVLLSRHATSAGFETVTATVPARPERPRGLTINIRASSTFVPGPGDPRTLGVMLDWIALEPRGIVLPPQEIVTGGALSTALLGAAVALLGATPGSAIGAALLIAAAQGGVLTRGFAPFSDTADVAVTLSATIAITMVVLVWLRDRFARQPLRNTARFALTFTAFALFLKLLVLLHPNMPIGDALFHAHRYQDVLDGKLYFTSIAPGNYNFPYAPGLYVAAAPLGGLASRGLGNVALLRVFVMTADAIAGLLIYLAIARGWGNRLAAAIAVALHHLVPLGFGIVLGGTLTNVFAQSMSVAALVVLSAPSVRLERPWTVGALIALLAAAFMSHTGTFAILSLTVFVTAVLFAWRGGPALRSPALAAALAGVAAIAVSVLVYYGHFIDTYRTELARIGQETAAAAPDAGGRSIADRAAAVPFYVNAYLGVPNLILAGWGALTLWRRGARDRLTLVMTATAVTCLAFLVLGVVTPVDMRHYLAALPAVVVFAAAGAAAAWRGGGKERAVSLLLLSWAVWMGIQVWYSALWN